ncbi:MAG: ABC transporter ATP-binding protein [Pseudomonadota bacterium]
MNGVTFSIAKGECFGLVGESGCGKSTVGRMLLKLVDSTSGRVFFNGTNINSLSGCEMKRLRSKMHIIYQDASSSLDPRYSAYRTLEEPLRIKGLPKPERREKILESADKVGIGQELFQRYPHELSGGQRQRLGIARALLQDPEFIVADEPAASLDLSVQAQILNLLETDKKERGTALLYISHNLRMMRFVSQRMAVMYLGRFLEAGSTERIFQKPLHPYTQMLFASLLCIDPNKRKINGKIGESQALPPSNTGCAFYTRCSLRKPLCNHEEPRLKETDRDHQVACHNV